MKTMQSFELINKWNSLKNTDKKRVYLLKRALNAKFIHELINNQKQFELDSDEFVIFNQYFFLPFPKYLLILSLSLFVASFAILNTQYGSISIHMMFAFTISLLITLLYCFSPKRHLTLTNKHIILHNITENKKYKLNNLKISHKFQEFFFKNIYSPMTIIFEVDNKEVQIKINHIIHNNLSIIKIINMLNIYYNYNTYIQPIRRCVSRQKIFFWNSILSIIGLYIISSSLISSLKIHLANANIYVYILLLATATIYHIKKKSFKLKNLTVIKNYSTKENLSNYIRNNLSQSNQNKPNTTINIHNEQIEIHIFNTQKHTIQITNTQIITKLNNETLSINYDDPIFPVFESGNSYIFHFKHNNKKIRIKVKKNKIKIPLSDIMEKYYGKQIEPISNYTSLIWHS